MTDLQKQLARFRRHVMLRLVAYAALCGLVAALVIVIAAPWLRDALGLPGYRLTLALPLAVPLGYVLLTLLRRPSERDIVLAADNWTRADGSIVSAWELERRHPDSPFVKPVADKAVARLKKFRPPEPRLARRMISLMLVMVALVWVSRLIHAQFEKSAQEERRLEAANLTDVDPEEARRLANEAGAVAEKAGQAGARDQQRLAEDIEQAAREAQAGGKEKERALREANSLADRARAQAEAQERRKRAREELAENPASRELGQAIDSADPERIERAIENLTDEVYRDGAIDHEKAEQLRQAVENAREQAPGDATLRRAAEDIENHLNPHARRNAEQRREQAAEEMRRDGLSEQQIEAAIDAMEKLDKEMLRDALEDFGEGASPLRDINPDAMKELMQQVKDAELTPEQARRLAETARRLSERLELDADTLREMLQKGGDFEGLDEAARKAMQGNEPAGPEEVPEWARDTVPEDLARKWRENGAEAARQGDSGKTSQGGSGSGSATGEGPGREVDGEGRREGVESIDSGDGERNPDGEEETLDPDKAGEETASRERTGREASSDGVNTRDEEERLPRRYRDAARKYFERD